MLASHEKRTIRIDDTGTNTVYADADAKPIPEEVRATFLAEPANPDTTTFAVTGCAPSGSIPK